MMSTAPVDAYARAEARLSAQRPLHHPTLQRVLGHLQAQRYAQADIDLKLHLAAFPADADALHLLAKLAVRAGRRHEAVTLFRRSLAALPTHDAARFGLARVLYDLHEPEAALQELELLRQRDPSSPIFRQVQANVLETLGDHAASLALLEALAQEHPQRAASWVSLGQGLRAVGRQADAVAAYRRAIACRPEDGAAYWGLADMRTLRFEPADLAALRAQLARTDLPEPDRVRLQFALAKGLEDEADYAAAFALYAQANETLRQRTTFRPETLASSLSHHKSLLTTDFFRRRQGSGCPASEPIFILGRPRSGSTLVEQILASHPAIEATAELPYIADLAARLEPQQRLGYGADQARALTELDDAALQGLGEDYLALTRPHRKQGRPHFIDKKPANFAHLGLIHLILPHAKIIDVRRHPAASCVSIFKSYSGKGRLCLDEMGQVVRHYLAHMAHFDAVLPGRVLRVFYEDLVADPEREIRRMLDHLGLPFDAACLRFHENDRPVLTPSSEQVRRPITGSAVDHWRHFAPWLDPLRRGLGSALEAHPAVPEELR